MEEESETFEPVTFRISGYLDYENNEHKFEKYDFLSISCPYKIICDFKTNDFFDSSYRSFDISVNKLGTQDVEFFNKNNTTNILTISCFIKDNSINIAAYFDNQKCILTIL